MFYIKNEPRNFNVEVRQAQQVQDNQSSICWDRTMSEMHQFIHL